jgi:hypothetical protein
VTQYTLDPCSSGSWSKKNAKEADYEQNKQVDAAVKSRDVTLHILDGGRQVEVSNNGNDKQLLQLVETDTAALACISVAPHEAATLDNGVVRSWPVKLQRGCIILCFSELKLVASATVQCGRPASAASDDNALLAYAASEDDALPPTLSVCLLKACGAQLKKMRECEQKVRLLLARIIECMKKSESPQLSLTDAQLRKMAMDVFKDQDKATDKFFEQMVSDAFLCCSLLSQHGSQLLRDCTQFPDASRNITRLAGYLFDKGFLIGFEKVKRFFGDACKCKFEQLLAQYKHVVPHYADDLKQELKKLSKCESADDSHSQGQRIRHLSDCKAWAAERFTAAAESELFITAESADDCHSLLEGCSGVQALPLKYAGEGGTVAKISEIAGSGASYHHYKLTKAKRGKGPLQLEVVRGGAWPSLVTLEFKEGNEYKMWLLVSVKPEDRAHAASCLLSQLQLPPELQRLAAAEGEGADAAMDAIPSSEEENGGNMDTSGDNPANLGAASSRKSSRERKPPDIYTPPAQASSSKKSSSKSSHASSGSELSSKRAAAAAAAASKQQAAAAAAAAAAKQQADADARHAELMVKNAQLINNEIRERYDAMRNKVLAGAEVSDTCIIQCIADRYPLKQVSLTMEMLTKARCPSLLHPDVHDAMWSEAGEPVVVHIAPCLALNLTVGSDKKSPSVEYRKMDYSLINTNGFNTYGKSKVPSMPTKEVSEAWIMSWLKSLDSQGTELELREKHPAADEAPLSIPSMFKNQSYHKDVVPVPEHDAAHAAAREEQKAAEWHPKDDDSALGSKKHLDDLRAHVLGQISSAEYRKFQQKGFRQHPHRFTELHMRRDNLLTLSTVSWEGVHEQMEYLKRLAAFNLHTEQLKIPFAHSQEDGYTLWYFVLEKDTAKLFAAAGKHFKKMWSSLSHKQLTAQEYAVFGRALVQAKLYCPTPRMLILAGIEPRVCWLAPRTMIVGRGNIHHAGGGSSNAVAVNYANTEWLMKDGLPFLEEYYTNYLPAVQAIMQKLGLDPGDKGYGSHKLPNPSHLLTKSLYLVPDNIVCCLARQVLTELECRKKDDACVCEKSDLELMETADAEGRLKAVLDQLHQHRQWTISMQQTECTPCAAKKEGQHQCLTCLCTDSGQANAAKDGTGVQPMELDAEPGADSSPKRKQAAAATQSAPSADEGPQTKKQKIQH